LPGYVWFAAHTLSLYPYFYANSPFSQFAKSIARADTQHYKDNTWVAGYNPLNEPTDSEHTRLLAFYDRVEKAIRAIDPDHILFLE